MWTRPRNLSLWAVLSLLGALGAARLVASRLYEISPTDPLVFGAVTFLLTAAILFSILVPAWRAARVNPIDVFAD